MLERQQHKTPYYYAKRHLLNNKPAFLGLLLIIFAHFIAGVGYLLMPDKTPYANDGAVQIQKQTPGFHVNILKIRKNMEVPKSSFFARMLNGQDSEYTIVPIKGNPRVMGDSIFFQPFRV